LKQKEFIHLIVSVTFLIVVDSVAASAVSFYYLTRFNLATDCTKVTTGVLWHLTVFLLLQFFSAAFCCEIPSYI